MRFYSRLDDGQCERLHDATLRVLERTGLIVDEPEGLELLRRAGAAVDEPRAYPGEARRLGAERRAQGSHALWARRRAGARCGGYEYSFGAGSDCMYCFDHRTGERRRAVLADSSSRRASRTPASASTSS